MRVLIDNYDGLGAVDYTAAVAADAAVGIDRRLNAGSSCRFGLLLRGAGVRGSGPGSLREPVRRARVMVSGEDGTVLFTGYLPGDAERQCVGAGYAGEDTVLLCAAESDDWLLDREGVLGAGGAGFALAGDVLLRSLTSRTDPARFSVQSAGVVRTLGLFAPVAGQPWSVSAGLIANGSYAAYRVVGGAVDLLPGGARTHRLREEEGTLDPMQLRLRAPRALANDVTVSGEREPAAYVTEVFAGDGTTAEFGLSGTPFRPSGRAAVPVFADSFTGDGLNAAVWQTADPGSHLSLGAAGLRLGGGSGLDGQTTLSSRDALELGGAIMLETAGVVLGAGSDGVLCAVYSGPVSRANCVAGFDVRQSGGATTLQALVQGAASGPILTLASGHRYRLRLRLFAAEMHRVLQTYYTMVDGVVAGTGGGLVPASVAAVLEVADEGVASNTPVTVLYDATMAGAPATATFVPVNSVQLNGSVGSVRVVRDGPLRVLSTSSAGVTRTRLLGAAGEGTDAELVGSRLVFASGRVPAAGETVRVIYRSGRRAAARVVDMASVGAEAASGLPGVAAWVGHVVTPEARSSADCANAAAALVRVATSRTAAIEGEYAVVNPGDIWPGDLLDVERDGGSTALMVRRVEVGEEHALPEVLRYRVTVANDWAAPLSLAVTAGLASDVALPVAAAAAGAAAPASLAGLTVVSVSGSVVQLDMGMAAPAGGGFEVRRRDGGFGPGQDADLVVRSPVRTFSVPRAAQRERWSVRMYDGSAVPVYSAVSAAVVIDVPVN